MCLQVVSFVKLERVFLQNQSQCWQIGKLVNQIARLAAIVVKYSVPTVNFAVTISHVLLLSKINGSDNKKYISVVWSTLASLALPLPPT